MSDTLVARHVGGDFDDALLAPELPGARVVCTGASRPVWLEARKPFYGGSDIAALLEIEGAYGSPRTVALDKLGQSEPSAETAAMKRGNYFEQGIAQWFSDESGIATIQPAPITMYASLSRPLAAASPDRLAVEGYEVIGWVEIKKVGAHRLSEWTGGVPEHYRAQVLWQLGVSGLPVGWLAADIDGVGLRWTEIEADPAWFEDAYRRVQEFDALLRAGQMPPVDGSEATKKAINAEFAQADPDPFEGGYELAAAVAELMDAQEAEKATKARLTKAENVVKTLLREHEVGTCDGQEIVTWKEQHRDGYSVEPTTFRKLFVPKGARRFFESMEVTEL